MRRTGDLFRLVTDRDNMLAAWYEVRKGKRMHYPILKVERNLPVLLEALREELLRGSYRPQPSRTFMLYDPKTRVIEAPHLRDRIVQHALTRVIRDVIEARLIRHTYACLRGRGTHAASEQVHRYLRQVPDGFVLKMDIRKFFPSIHHDTLMAQVSRIIKCRPTLDLLGRFVRANNSGRGLAIGATTSQILANLALNPLDQAAKRDLGLRRYVRYMDDSVMVHASREALRQALSRLTEVVHDLGLEVNPKSCISRVRHGLDFVGYRHFVGTKLIRKRSLYGIRKALAAGPTLPRVMAYLSHAKGTGSLAAVTRLCVTNAPAYKMNVLDWRSRHA